MIPARKPKENQRKIFWTTLALLLVGLIGCVDYLLGHEIFLSLFYVVPISLTAWLANRRTAVMVSGICATVWLIADLSAGHLYTHPLIPLWNALIRLATFLIIAMLLSRLQKSLAMEKHLSRTDNLTGATNSRYFQEILDREAGEGRPFALACIDCDNFKEVNDTLGHSAGDEVLQTVVGCLHRRLRSTDVVGRLGGDEFAIFFYDMNPSKAEQVINSLQRELLNAMQARDWPVTFSIGVVAETSRFSSTDALIRTADDLMYSSKKNGKNQITIQRASA